MSYTKKVAYNAAVQIFSKAVGVLLSFFSVALLTRYLGVYGYGQYTSIFAFCGFAAVLADLGFYMTLVRELSTGKKDQSYVMSHVLTQKLLLAFSVFLISCFIAQLIPSYSHEIKLGIFLGSLALFLNSVNQTTIGVFQANFRVDKAVIGELVSRLLMLLGLIYVSKTELSLYIVLWINIFCNFVNLLISYFLSKRYVKISFAFDKSYWIYIFRSAFSLGIVSLLSILYYRNDMLILSFLKGPVDVGIYGVPYKVFDIVVTLPGMMVGSTFPVIARYLNERNEKINPALQKTFNFLVILSIPIAIGGVYFASDIISLIGGNEYLASHTITVGAPITAVILFKILSLALFFMFISSLFSTTIVAANMQRKLILPTIIAVLFNLGLNIIFIPRFSYLASASTTLLTEVFMFGTSLYLFNKYIQIPLRSLKIYGKAVLSALVMILVVRMFQINFFAEVVIAGLVYLSLITLLGGFTREDLINIFGRKAQA